MRETSPLSEYRRLRELIKRLRSQCTEIEAGLALLSDVLPGESDPRD
jgi:hypothetical protein